MDLEAGATPPGSADETPIVFEDFVLDGQLIPKNESVALWYPSGNRDENKFSNSQKFDISRSPNKHVAFGHGAHLCLGQHLARMEIRALFKELLSRVHDVRLIDQYRYTHTAFVGGLKSLPIQTS